ncbi:hypothetical protein D3C73_1407910 [compost metagenome]
MHRNDHLGQAPCFLGGQQFAFQFHSAHIAGIRLYVDKVDLGTTIERAIGRGDETDGGSPDPVARSHSQRKTGDVQGGGA